MAKRTMLSSVGCGPYTVGELRNMLEGFDPDTELVIEREETGEGMVTVECEGEYEIEESLRTAARIVLS